MSGMPTNWELTRLDFRPARLRILCMDLIFITMRYLCREVSLVLADVRSIVFLFRALQSGFGPLRETPSTNVIGKRIGLR